MKIAIIGANGQLGNDLVTVLCSSHQLFPLTHQDIEISSLDSVFNKLKDLLPDLVINTAAFHNVLQCENNPEKSFSINSLGAWNLAKLCKQQDIPLVHISTDYVFNGEKRIPYTEEDVPAPLNAYGITKLAGENFIRYTHQKHFIIRTSGLYGRHQCRAKTYNFVQLMLKLAREKKEIKVVNDETLTPTYTHDLALQIKILIATNNYGIFHITNAGSCTWYQFACEIFSISKTNIDIIPVPASTFPSSVKRPSYSVLENQHLKYINLNFMRSWQDALRDYLNC